MHNPPSSMVRQTQALAALIRSPLEDNTVCRYSEFIRDNVFAVLNNTFPLFCQQVDQDQLLILVDEFVVVHYASEPEFHHIATEFVSFVQRRTRQCISLVWLPRINLQTINWQCWSTNGVPSALRLIQQMKCDRHRQSKP